MASFNHTRKRYDVFISFRGTDCRDNFTSHLHAAFGRKSIRAYLDEESLQQGDEISPALMKAIQDSKICVVILSENYADSSWCLEELAHIIQFMELGHLIVMPVLYRVAKSDVREQQGRFGAAFDGLRDRRKQRTKKVEQEQRWGFGAAFDGLKHRLMKWTKAVEQPEVEQEQRGSSGVELDALDEQFEQWRKALRAVADIWGWDSAQIRPDAKLIEEIVNVIWKRLYDMASSDPLPQGLVGVDKRCGKLESLLHLESTNDVRVVGIWGMGGLGKTTIADLAFKRFSSQFEACCFLDNVKKKSTDTKSSGLQKHLISQLLNENNFNMVNKFAIERLQRTKVLIVLDDVDEVEQWEQIVGDLSWFCGGSRIMITTRDKQVLNNIGCHDIYEVESLDWEESLELFSSKAFRAKSPPPNFMELSQGVIGYAKDNPLALTVLGRHLYSKSVPIWESELNKLQRIPNMKIHDVMKISYDGLDPNAKAIFLDIAHFFNDNSKSLVEAILDARGHFVATGIQELIDKSLLTIKCKAFLIHDLLREMALQIVREESPKPGERSRLCSTEEILSVLEYNKGTEVVEGMYLKTNAIGDAIQVNPLVFKEMPNLRYLKFHDDGNACKFPTGIQFIPKNLSCLDWKFYPLKSFPSEFIPKHLVELRMEGSDLEHLWSGTQQLGRLKILDLDHCKNLKEVPDLSQARNLENLSLYGCEHLYQLPINIYKLKKLQRLDVSLCKKLEGIPEIREEMENLKHLVMSGAGITELPKSIENLTESSIFEELNLLHCINLKSIPAQIYDMKITQLNLTGCSSITSLPPFSGGLEFLERLLIQKTGILQVPEWVFSLPSLEWLNVSETAIERIPEGIKQSSLRKLITVKCKRLRYLPELPPSLWQLLATGCSSMETVSFSSKGHGNTKVSDTASMLFWNCYSLDSKSIQEEFLIRCARSRELGGVGRKVFMCYPGNQIPKWCPNQNEGCVVKFSGLNFVDLVFCLVLEKNEDDGEDYDDVLGCQIYIKNSDGLQSVKDDEMFIPNIDVIDTEHVIMFYKVYDDLLDFSSALEVIINFEGPINCNIKCCGYNILPPSPSVEKFAATV